MNIIEIKNATAYRGNNLGLNNISLSIPLGEHHAILGPNGAGKSTLLKLITREISPVFKDNLTLKLFDKERFTLWSLREKIGVVSQDFQDNYQSPTTGLGVVISAYLGSIGVHQHHQVKPEMIEKAEAMLHGLGLSELADQPYLEMSHGQKRQLILARAIAHEPQALILDEPTNALDLKARFWFLKTIRKLAQGNTSIILVTHEPAEIIPEIKKVTLLKRGEIAFSGQKESALEEARISELYDIPISMRASDGYFYAEPK
jgi:iron complex transport system ATP-binding protein